MSGDCVCIQTRISCFTWSRAGGPFPAPRWSASGPADTATGTALTNPSREAVRMSHWPSVRPARTGVALCLLLPQPLPHRAPVPPFRLLSPRLAFGGVSVRCPLISVQTCCPSPFFTKNPQSPFYHHLPPHFFAPVMAEVLLKRWPSLSPLPPQPLFLGALWRHNLSVTKCSGFICKV